MGCDCINYFPLKTNGKDVEEFLVVLGYTKLPRDRYTPKGVTALLYHPNDYKYFVGVYAEKHFDKAEGLIVHTHTSIWRSRYDTDFHNHTVKQLRKRFGGYFESDNGRNKYLTNDYPYIDKAEAGCYQAFGVYFNNIQRASYTIDTWMSAKTEMDWSSKKMGVALIDQMNPLVATVNMAIPLIVSIIEDYFKSSYIALLKYSPQKEAIIRDCRIQGEELILLTKGEITLEDAVARSRSFQDMKRIAQSYRELDKNIDVYGTLKRPYRRRKTSIYDTIESIIVLRHRIIHRAELILGYTPQLLLRDIRTIHVGIERFYRMLISLYGWFDEHPELDRSI